MKKIIILTVGICAGLISQAAVANWSASALNIYNGTGGTATSDKFSGTAYIFDAGKKSQADLYTLICAGTIGSTTEGYVSTASVGSGAIKLASTTFSYGEQSASESSKNDYTYYFVIVDDDKAYFSNEMTVSANATATAYSIAFGNQKAGSSVAPTGSSFAGASAWSSTASIPEPTSAMLLMLGLCGLALKRKNA